MNGETGHPSKKKLPAKPPGMAPAEAPATQSETTRLKKQQDVKSKLVVRLPLFEESVAAAEQVYRGTASPLSVSKSLLPP